VVGPGRCRTTSTVREFLYKNFVPFTWYDTETEAGRRVLAALGSPPKAPVIECGNGRILVNPSLRQLASEAGIWRPCPTQEVDFAACYWAWGWVGGACRTTARTALQARGSSTLAPGWKRISSMLRMSRWSAAVTRPGRR